MPHQMTKIPRLQGQGTARSLPQHGHDQYIDEQGQLEDLGVSIGVGDRGRQCGSKSGSLLWNEDPGCKWKIC